jgi:hypothetical protein
MKRINRRKFLKKAASATAAAVGFPYIVPSSVLGDDSSVAPSNRIVMGCIGVGGKGTGDMHAFLQKTRVHIVAVCDVSAELRNKARGKIQQSRLRRLQRLS